MPEAKNKINKYIFKSNICNLAFTNRTIFKGKDVKKKQAVHPQRQKSLKLKLSAAVGTWRKPVRSQHSSSVTSARQHRLSTERPGKTLNYSKRRKRLRVESVEQFLALENL